MREADIAALKERVLRSYERIGTIKGTADEVGTERKTVRKYLKEAGIYDNRPLFAGRVAPFEQTSRPLPKKGGIKRYILTCMQNNTKVNQRFWDNLLTLADHYNAEVMVSTFSYNKSSFGPKAVKRGQGPAVSDKEDVWYDPDVDEKYLTDTQIEIAPSLVFCGEMNIEPTAVSPLTGLEVYTGRKSSIFGHTKTHMKSVASGKNEATKFTYTTGTITKRNYIAKKAGLRAEFHHVYGALLVEVDSSGNWFARQLIGDASHSICDLDIKVEDAEIMKNQRVESIVWGDIHEATLDETVSRLAWGPKGMLDTLRPKFQFMHDILDFRARNSHTAKKNLIHDRFKAYMQGHDSVEEEIENVSIFLKRTVRAWCKTIIVHSNHDAFLMEWLRIGSYRNDPVNAVFFLRAQLHVYESIEADPEANPQLLKWVCDQFLGGEKHEFRFLEEDESFLVKDIEHGMHGHLGPNGARGTAGNLARMGRKMNRGHEHSAGIFEGVYTSGLAGENDQGYNKGPSSWSPSHIVTYNNGKRAIYTMWGGKWRA